MATITTSTKKEPESKVPLDFQKALRATTNGMALWQDITPIARRDFITWIEGAKQPQTRARRIQIACSKLVAGDRRPCCYAVTPMGLYKALGENPRAKATWKTLTPTARRDFVGWVEEAKDSTAKKLRIEKACSLLASGKEQP